MVGTLELAVVCRALGRSLGQRALGLAVVGVAGGRPTLRQRLARLLLWNLTLPVQPVFALLGRPLPTRP